ncbi:MAG: aminopeptidase P family protein [Planctomycetes bacterium]|nr:aminopeptidase P family protein [Planctomycetota bacterium]
MTAVPEAEILARIRSLQARFAAASPPVDAALILQSLDLYYFAGTIQNCHLLVPREGRPRLLVRKVLERARADSPLEDVRPMTSLKALPGEIRSLCGPPPWRLGMELDVLPVLLFNQYLELLGGQGQVEVADLSRPILEIRSVKSEWEIGQIRAAARINDRLYRDLPELLGENLSTGELQAVLDARARLAGHLGAVRMRGFNMECLLGVVVSGPSGAAPGHGQFPIGGTGPHPALALGGDARKIERDRPVVFDYLANATGYHHDQTRMAVIGRLPEEAERIYGEMQGLLRLVEKRLVPGAVPSQIYEEALARAKERGLEAGFLGPPGHAVGFVGHGLGLEVNEIPVLARRFVAPLAAGTVLAVEPKFTHPELGVIGLENTYAVRAGQPENLSLSPEEVIVVR